MNKPHKHAELIKAWADGAEIEYLIRNTEWRTTTQPAWDSCTEYRIKKHTVKTVGYRRYYTRDDRGVFCALTSEVSLYTPEILEKLKGFVAWKDQEWQYDEVEI